MDGSLTAPQHPGAVAVSTLSGGGGGGGGRGGGWEPECTTPGLNKPAGLVVVVDGSLTSPGRRRECPRSHSHAAPVGIQRRSYRDTRGTLFGGIRHSPGATAPPPPSPVSARLRTAVGGGGGVRAVPVTGQQLPAHLTTPQRQSAGINETSDR